jgi:hypothetical protein
LQPGSRRWVERELISSSNAASVPLQPWMKKGFRDSPARRPLLLFAERAIISSTSPARPVWFRAE